MDPGFVNFFEEIGEEYLQMAESCCYEVTYTLIRKLRKIDGQGKHMNRNSLDEHMPDLELVQMTKHQFVHDI